MTERPQLSMPAMASPSCIIFTEADFELGRHAEVLEADGTLGSSSVVSEPGEFLAAVEAHRPHIVVADLGADPEAVLDLLEKLPTPRPRLLVIGPPDRSGTILRAMRMGVREYFEEPPTEDRLRRVIQQLAEEIVPEPETATKPARVVAVMGAKGGTGATVVACQLAASLQASGARVAVVDLNLPLGDVSLYFDVQPSYTIANIARETQRLDPTYLRTLMQGKPGGVQVLASPSQVEEAELVRAPHVEQVLELLRQDFDWVILDVSRIFGEPTVRALDLADQILLVALLDVSTLHHSRQLLDLLERLGHTGRRVRLLANRYAPDSAVSDKDVLDFLGREIDFRMPNDFATAAACINQGVAVAEFAPRSAFARAIGELNRSLHNWSDKEPPAVEARGALARAVRLFRRS